jgi:hypothetical protein
MHSGLHALRTEYEPLTAEREQVRKIHNMNFRHLDILLLQLQKNAKMALQLQKNTKMAKTYIVNFSDLFPFCS